MGIPDAHLVHLSERRTRCASGIPTWARTAPRIIQHQASTCVTTLLAELSLLQGHTLFFVQVWACGMHHNLLNLLPATACVCQWTHMFRQTFPSWVSWWRMYIVQYLLTSRQDRLVACMITAQLSFLDLQLAWCRHSRSSCFSLLFPLLCNLHTCFSENRTILDIVQNPINSKSFSVTRQPLGAHLSCHLLDCVCWCAECAECAGQLHVACQSSTFKWFWVEGWSVTYRHSLCAVSNQGLMDAFCVSVVLCAYAKLSEIF